MKIGGVDITGELAEPNEDILVLPRRKTQIVLTARAISDMSDFDKKVPAPKPKKNFHKGKGWISDLKDPTYIKEMEQYAKIRVAYFIVASLQDMEWKTVDIKKPITWVNWEADFKSVGFSQHECNLILQFCFGVNQLDEQKLEQARSLFVLGQELGNDESSSQTVEPESTQSGEPVNDLVSNPQE